MSQPGPTQPTSSEPAASEKPALVPTKAQVDDEAEEGEIFDEEEGEISESRPSEPAGIVTPSQPAKTKEDQPVHTSPKQPATPELPINKSIEGEGKEQERANASMDVEAAADAAKAAPPNSQDAKPSDSAPQEEQAPAELSIASALEKFEENSAAQEPNVEQVPATAASSVPTPEPVTEPQQEAAQVSQPKDLSDPSTPKLAEPALTQAEEKPVDTSAPEESSSAAQAGEAEQNTKEAPLTSSTSSAAAAAAAAEPLADAAGVKPVSEATKNDETAEMDIDEKAASPAPAVTEEKDQPAGVVPEPMQVDDSVHTPALPSDGPEGPVETNIESVAEDAAKTSEVVHEANPTETQVKVEPQQETYEEASAAPTREAEPAQPEPSDAPQHEEEEDLPQEPVPRAAEDFAQESESRVEDRLRSPQPQPLPDAAASGVRRSEEVYARPANERDEPSISRRIGSEAPPSRSSNRGSAVPASAQDKRIERTKERSHQPSERSQDREQRAREKDRRREMERIERERERERERIRESERDREMMIARENEESRLIWLSLPGNDHPQYYTDTDSDSCYNVGGALGVDITDEEDKDLDPPLPLSLQEYHPAPSYSSTYYDNSYYAPKRKRIDDGADDDVHATSRRFRRKPISGPSPASSSSRPTPREALPSTAMIDIDNFPVPDSSIRGEPSERPFASRIERPSLPRISAYTRADDGLEEYESSDSDEEAMRIAEERKRRHGNRGGNRGNKLSREKGARWVRRGKLGGWTEMRMEKEIGDRVRHRVEAMQKDNVRALLSAMPDEDKAMLAQFPALRNGLIPGDAPSSARRDARGKLLPSDLSEAARIDAELGLDGGSVGPSGSRLERPEHLTSTSLAPTLLKPAITPRQLLTSHTLRHTFRNPHIAALGKTALDLIESEGVVGRAVGRCWSAMERGGWNEDPEPKGDEVDGADGAEPNGMDVDGSDAEGSTRHLNGDGGANGAASNLFGSPIDNPALSHLDKLFVTKQGLAIPRLDEVGQPIFVPSSPATRAARAQAGLAEEAANEAVVETTLLPAPEQRSIVLAALECLHDLAADSREYVERLEEVRSRLAAVKRRRAQVWNAVRQWALDKDMEASQASGGARLGAGVGSTGAAASELSSAVTAAATAVANGSSPKKRK